MLKKTLWVCAVAVCVVSPVSGDVGLPVDVASRAKGAERAFVASVEHVSAAFQANDFGDQVIVTRAQLRVKEVMKGPGAVGDAIAVEVEGGTVGGLTLRVSDLPDLNPGERAVFFLGRGSRGEFVPHLRGLGIMKLDAGDRVLGNGMTLADVRRGVNSR